MPQPAGGFVVDFPPYSHAELFKLPLRIKGRHVVDAKGKRFKLASVNWYGASDEN